MTITLQIFLIIHYNSAREIAIEILIAPMDSSAIPEIFTKPQYQDVMEDPLVEQIFVLILLGLTARPRHLHDGYLLGLTT